MEVDLSTRLAIAKLLESIELKPSYVIAANSLPGLKESPKDPRVQSYAKNQKQLFGLVFSDKKNGNLVLLINPKRQTGLLFWKKYDSLLLTEARLNALKSQSEDATPEELSFFNRLPINP